MVSRVVAVRSSIPSVRRFEKRVSQYGPLAVDFKGNDGSSQNRASGQNISNIQKDFSRKPLPVSNCGPVEQSAPNMKSHRPSRLCLGAALMLLFAAMPVFARGRAQKNPPPPVVVKPNRPETPRAEARAAIREEHIPQWMANHSNLPLAEQQRALEQLPGFHELPPQTQQRYRDQLGRLNNMNPQQRTRMLDRNEALERLSPQQRQQYRDAVQRLTALPIPRRRVLARAILDLREMPPQQRQQVLTSPAFAGQFSPDERSTIGTLLTAEPYPPTRAPNEAP
jgi:hypothetical protein